MEEIRTYYQIPSIAHFCNLFRDCLNLPDFDYEDLEFPLLSKISSDDSEVASNESNLILKLIFTLLRGYFDTSINHSNWEKYLQKLFQIQWVGIEKKRSPFVGFDDNGQEISLRFDDLSLRTKVDVIHCLCDYRLFADDICQRISDVNAEEYRVEPLGTDSNGYIYWYFYGTRLYREDPSLAEALEQRYKKLEDLAEKKAKEKLRKEQELEKKQKEEEKKKKKSLPPKVQGLRTGLRQRKSDQTLTNGVCPSNSVDSKTNSADKSSKQTIEDLKEVTLDERREAWSLVCNTEQDWNDLTLKFSKSKYKTELDLHRVLTKRFLPIISEIFENKEKEKQRIERQKLLELLPRRASSRIELRKIQKEREEIEEQEYLRKQKEEEEHKNVETERHRSERIKKDREIRAQKRIQLVEERAERALKRSVLEMNGEDSFGNPMETIDSPFAYITEDFIETSEEPISSTNISEFYEGLEKVITSVNTNRDAWPFAEAVDGNKFPMYYQVITNPIDLSIIQKKVEKREYEKFEEFENDFKLMINNCETFNGPKNGYTLMAYGVWRAFKRASLKYLNQELTHTESTCFIYPPKVSNTNIKPAIEAKKKKMRNKRRNTFKALNVLAEAAEKAVEANDSRLLRQTTSKDVSNDISLAGSASNSNLSWDSMASQSTDDSKVPVQVHGDMLANFLFNASQQVVCSTTQCLTANPSNHENLTFKSLDEWSKSIKQSGNYVVLPQHAVIISSPSVPQFTHCTNGPTVRPKLSLKVVSSGNTPNVSDIVNTNSGPTFTSSVISNNENASKELINADPKRLVIKLSRCEAQQVWRPVTIISSSAQNNITTSVDSNQQSIVSSTQQFQGLRTWPTNCVPVKKRLVIPDLTKQTDGKPSMALNMSQISQNTNSPSFQITGIEGNQKTNLKIIRLKKLDQSSGVPQSNSSSTNQSQAIPKIVLMPFDKRQKPNGNTSSSGLS